MKTKIKILLVTIVFSSAFLLNGCILDALNTLTQNIPISKTFTVNSSQTSYSKSETIDLSNSATYQSYSDKIQQIKFLQAQFRAKNVQPADLSGTVTFTLKDNKGNLLFTYPLGQINPADYTKTPYQLNLSAAQIGLINAYLSTLSNKTFEATFSIDNIQSSVKPYSFDGIIDIVFEMKAKTN